MNMVIKCLLAALWLLAVPWAAGGTVFYKSKKKSDGHVSSCRVSSDVFRCGTDDTSDDVGKTFAAYSGIQFCGSYGCGSCGRIYFYVQRKTYVRETVKKNTWKHRYISVDCGSADHFSAGGCIISGTYGCRRCFLCGNCHNVCTYRYRFFP